MKALVLAGGFGTRLKEVIHDRPKVMAEINGRPFLEYILEVLRKNGLNEIVISIGFLGDFVRNHFGDGKEFGLKIHYCEEKYPLGTGGAVKEAERFFKETFLVLNGDTYLDTDLSKVISFHRQKRAESTIVLTRRRSVKETGLVLQGKVGEITSFLEKPSKDKEGLINCGYYILEPEVLKGIKKGKRISLEKEVFPSLVKRGVLYGIEVKENFIDIGTPKSYQKAREVLSKKKRRQVLAQAPVRISFSGGGTDLPIYFLKNGGCVISGTINKYAHVLIKTTQTSLIRVRLSDYQKEETYTLGKPLPYDGGVFDLYKAVINRLRINSGLEIEVWGDFPLGSGLGTSSAVAVAVVGAILKLNGQRVDEEKAAKLTIEIEREILKIPGGWQDQYASSFGGLNFLEFLPGGKVKIAPLNLDKKILGELEESLLLFSLATKRSEKPQQEYLTTQVEEEKKTKEALNDLKILARQMRDVLKAGKIANFGALLHKAWIAKRKSSPKITTGLTNKMYETAVKAGAWGGKLLGAGGGGCLLFCAPTEKKEKISKALEKKGGRLLPFKFEFEGLRIETYDD